MNKEEIRNLINQSKKKDKNKKELIDKKWIAFIFPNPEGSIYYSIINII